MECECEVKRAYSDIKHKLLIINYLTNVLYKRGLGRRPFYPVCKWAKVHFDALK